MEKPYGDVDLELIKILSENYAIGSYEKNISKIIKEQLEEIVDDIQYDTFGSIICLKKGSSDGPKIMISAHMDEVGFMVRYITEEGFIKLLPVGGWWGHVMPAQEMAVITSSGKEYIGVVGSKAPHGMSSIEKNKVIQPLDLYLDMGVANNKELDELGIQIGDMICPYTEFRVMNNPNYLCGKAWDDRICLAVVIQVLKKLKDCTHDANIYFVGSTQEEVGIRGARTATHIVKPDVAIALDVTTSKDTPLEVGGDMRLGKGVIISVLDSLTLGNKDLIKTMKSLGKVNSLDLNYDFMTVGGTDACNIHKSMEGVPTMTLSIPTRYMHSSRLIVHRKDYAQTVTLLSEFCRNFSTDMLNKIKN